jgi:dipeptidyl aminopeptidase/acylaminoacyl peptidase
MRRAVFPALLCLAFALPVDAQRVTVEAGNVVYQPRSGAPRRLTASGRDASPALSPDGRTVAFVRATPGRTVAAGSGDAQATELWVVGTDGAGARMLVRGRDGASPEEVLAGLAEPRFSPDGRLLYFASQAWVTSSAVHVVDLGTGRERFVLAGDLVDVVPRGEYAGHLLVGQHRYFLGGGSFDWIWLFTPDGREAGPVGDGSGAGVEQFRELYVDP